MDPLLQAVGTGIVIVACGVIFRLHRVYAGAALVVVGLAMIYGPAA